MKYSETCRVNCKVKPSCRKKFYRTKLQEKVDNRISASMAHSECVARLSSKWLSIANWWLFSIFKFFWSSALLLRQQCWTGKMNVYWRFLQEKQVLMIFLPCRRLCASAQGQNDWSMLFVCHQNIIAPIFVLVMIIFVQRIFPSIVLHVAMIVANIMNMITLMTSIMGSMQKLNASSAYFAGPAVCIKLAN